MDDFKPELLKALLEWVNTFELPGRVTAWNQLEDGQILWQILADIDPDYFSESLPNFDETQRRTSDNWIPRWQNLKYIERAVSKYIRDECEQLPVLTKRMIPELKTGGRDGSMMLTAKLTMAVLLAGCYSPKYNQRLVKIMTEFKDKTGETIAAAIQEMQALDARMAALGVDQELTPEPAATGYRTPTRAVSGGSAMGLDNGLEQEAQLFEANKDRNQLRNQVTKLQTELENNKARISELEEQLVEARLHLDVSTKEKDSSEEYEQLRVEASKDRQYIDELETDLANARDTLESQQRQLERLKADDSSKQDLKDQLQFAKQERDEYSQKAKATENLKKKIQTLTQETKALESLRQDYQAARERLQELEAIEERADALEKVRKENSEMIAQCEQSLFDEKARRTRVENDNQMLKQQLDQAREIQYKLEEAKKEVEDKVRDLESTAPGARGSSLEDELAQDDDADKLSAPPSARTPADRAATAELIALQQKVDILNTRLKSLEGEVLKLMTENQGLRADIMNAKDDEAQKPFLEQNQRLQTTESELQELQRQMREKDLEMAELRNELNKKSDISEEAKAEGLQAENERLLAFQQKTNKKIHQLELSNEEKASLLRAALLDRDNLSPELQELKKAETLRRVREQIERVAKAPADTRPRVIDTTASELADTILASQSALDGAKKDLDEVKAMNESLRQQLEKSKKEGAEKGSVELQQEVENLRRENKLITSAWYDMTTRLQSNTVVLQRKPEAPKSWLGRQRIAVGGNSSSMATKQRRDVFIDKKVEVD